MNFSRELHSLQCPKCKHGMEEVTFEDITIDRCTHCHGLWFDGDEAQRLKHREGSETIDSGTAAQGRKYDGMGDINCPRCGDTMEKSSHWKQEHIWYEICRKHGIFMDAGEFTDFKYDSMMDVFRGWLKGKR
ncbi:MAG: zf-TFIIB domain-containing protein [Gammaproteobacteria bacterium]|nr:zf-TFIIB domain-containing protein [Gammaproteobacteria bacterium]